MIVSFTLKRISGNDATKENGSHETVINGEQDKKESSIPEETKQEVSEDTKDIGDHVKNAADAEEMETDKSGAETEAQGSEDAEKSSDAPVETKDQGTGEKKSTAASYRDNKDVVLREDLKAVFQKFGNVKVPTIFSNLGLC